MKKFVNLSTECENRQDTSVTHFVRLCSHSDIVLFMISSWIFSIWKRHREELEQKPSTLSIAVNFVNKYFLVVIDFPVLDCPMFLFFELGN